jgi:amino acid transporter
MVPDRALLAISGTALVLAVAVAVTGRYVYLINMGAAIESAMYAAAALSLIGLRRREPDARPFYRAPGGTVLPVVVGAIFLVLSVISAVFAKGDLPLPGVPWGLVILALLAAASAYHVYRVAPALRAGARARTVSGSGAGRGA